MATWQKVAICATRLVVAPFASIEVAASKVRPLCTRAKSGGDAARGGAAARTPKIVISGSRSPSHAAIDPKVALVATRLVVAPFVSIELVS